MIVDGPVENAFMWPCLTAPPNSATLPFREILCAVVATPPPRLCDMSTDSTPSSPSCRILTIASSLDQGVQLVNRASCNILRLISVSNVCLGVKSLSASLSGSAKPSLESPPQAASSPVSTTRNIPWTISNKYYTADVHFSLYSVHEVQSGALGDGGELAGVPAVLYVWGAGEVSSVLFPLRVLLVLLICPVILSICLIH